MVIRLTQPCSPLSVDGSENLLDGAMTALFPTAISAMGSQTWALVGTAATLPRRTEISGHNSPLSFMKGSGSLRLKSPILEFGFLYSYTAKASFSHALQSLSMG